MSRMFEWDEDLEDFFPNISNTSLYNLFDYETVEVLAKVRTVNGIYIAQTRLDMFVVDREMGIDPDLFETIPDEPIYIFRGINKWDKVDWEIQEVMEVLEWKL